MKGRTEPSRDLGGVRWLELWKGEDDGLQQSPRGPEVGLSPQLLRNPRGWPKKGKEEPGIPQQPPSESSATLSCEHLGQKEGNPMIRV